MLRAAHKLVRKSRIQDPTLVDVSNMQHYHPLMDVPAHNRFLKSVVPFLERTIAESRGRESRSEESGAAAEEAEKSSQAT